MKQSLFKIIFTDNTICYGGNYYKTNWLQFPYKKIKQIFYRLPDDNYLFLHNYDKYYHMMEAVMDFNGKAKDKQLLQYAYIMGKKDKEVSSYRITLFENKDSRYKIGDIVIRKFNINDKFIVGLNGCNWW